MAFFYYGAAKPNCLSSIREIDENIPNVSVWQRCGRDKMFFFWPEDERYICVIGILFKVPFYCPHTLLEASIEISFWRQNSRFWCIYLVRLTGSTETWQELFRKSNRYTPLEHLKQKHLEFCLLQSMAPEPHKLQLLLWANAPIELTVILGGWEVLERAIPAVPATQSAISATNSIMVVVCVHKGLRHPKTAADIRVCAVTSLSSAWGERLIPAVGFCTLDRPMGQLESGLPFPTQWRPDFCSSIFYEGEEKKQENWLVQGDYYSYNWGRWWLNGSLSLAIWSFDLEDWERDWWIQSCESFFFFLFVLVGSCAWSFPPSQRPPYQLKPKIFSCKQ